MRSNSDWATPLRISPQTCTKLRSCLCSAVLSLRWIRGLASKESTYIPQSHHLETVVGRSMPDICSSVRTVEVGIYLLPLSFARILIICCCFYRIFKTRDMASGRSPYRDQAGPSCAPSDPLPGTFLGLSLDIRSEKLYDLAPDIPDVMGLRALRPSAAVVKGMSVRDSQSIRVVTPDDHYLRRIWPRALFAFLTRYQQDLECKRKERKEWFGCTQSGNCTLCGKYIQMDLGKHIAFYHLELAQLRRCLVMWCTVWKGTAQDCIDHMRRTHKVPLSVKVANLSKFFPAWTVTREQWADMLMPSISGVAIDMLLFSRIGSPLCHRYRLISRTGSHAAFRGTYLRRLRAFLDESDSAVVRRLHRRLAQELASHVVMPTDSPASVQPRSAVGHLQSDTVSQSRRPCRLKGVTHEAGGPESSCRLPAQMSSIQALMDLALPRFAGLADGPRQIHPPWSHVVQLTRRRCRRRTSTWMCFRYHQRRSRMSWRNIVICR